MKTAKELKPGDSIWWCEFNTNHGATITEHKVVEVLNYKQAPTFYGAIREFHLDSNEISVVLPGNWNVIFNVDGETGNDIAQIIDEKENGFSYSSPEYTSFFSTSREKGIELLKIAAQKAVQELANTIKKLKALDLASYDITLDLTPIRSALGKPPYMTATQDFYLDISVDLETRKKVFNLLLENGIPIHESTLKLNGVPDTNYPWLAWDSEDVIDGGFCITECHQPVTEDIYSAKEFLAQFGIAFE